ncbi:UNVERIFIED_CONTAM: hypothetical protein Slati_3763700 [Sesamum latifolium]|uniref:Integrase zinc-binding domain-containing protein n=1 Tax=Sesamum latifolium TaxID=2727402 RepID=A0AAW2U422_9LAMI
MDRRRAPPEWEAVGLKTRATRFLVQAGTLYKRSYTHPLLRCLSTEEGAHVLQEIHSGCCGAHAGTWTLANKALRPGYFWPTVKQDAKHLESQMTHYVLPDELHYFSFNYACQWFCLNPFSEIVNCHQQDFPLVGGYRKGPTMSIPHCVKEQGDNMIDDPTGSTGESPFSLVYGTEAIIPAELGTPSHRVMNFSEEYNRDLLKENLDLIEELREKAFIHMQRYKNTMINSYNKRVRARM